MKDFYKFLDDSPFWKKIWFSILICFIFGFAWNIREIFNNEIISIILEFICFLTGYILMDRYAYWLYKNSVKKDNKNE